MINSKDIMDKLIDRAKNLGEYHVPVRVDEGWMPQGKVPYDISISDGVAIFSVYALSFDEACVMVEHYMREQS